jgi:hypothetical protein
MIDGVKITLSCQFSGVRQKKTERLIVSLPAVIFTDNISRKQPDV